jgi:MOSC domain-containing protein YiiM
VPQVLSVNVGAGVQKSYAKVRLTGIDKRPADGPVAVRAPGRRRGSSGVAGDFIGDERHHGGDRQAVYAFQREDLDRWQRELGRPLPNGSFGENLTTTGIDLEQVLVGERWSVGDPSDELLELEVTDPRIPCRTFAGFLAERGWVKRFTADGRPGTYLSVVRGGTVRAGDEVRRTFVPDHDVTIGLLFRATTSHRELLPRLLEARDYLDEQTLALVERRETFALDEA